MRLHHLDGGGFNPPFAPLINGSGFPLARGRLSAHCLLVESLDGLVLIDAGLGSAFLNAPAERLGRFYDALFQPDADPARSLLWQVEALGFFPDEVKDLVLTHMDFDHAGGLSDFPQARVHVSAIELATALHPEGATEARRYDERAWAHRPRWVPHRLDDAPWFGLASSLILPEHEAEIRLVALPGHTLGHCGVAVRTPEGWVLHAGDAYYHHRELRGTSVPPLLRLVERVGTTEPGARARSLKRLRELEREGVRIFCTHDPAGLAQPAPVPAERRAVRKRP